jgi:Dolichyl-phosphate-mannose-protein mannosyltransferase
VFGVRSEPVSSRRSTAYSQLSVTAPLRLSRRHDPVTRSRPTIAKSEAQWSIGLMLAVSALLLFVLVTFAVAHRTWPAAFVLDLGRWLHDPEIGGRPATPAGLAIAIPVLAAIAVEGWFASRLILSASRMERERWLELGLAIVLGISLLGLAALTGVALGALGRFELLAFYTVTGALLAWAWKAQSGKRKPGRRQHVVASPGTRGPWFLGVVTAFVVSVVVVFSLGRAAMTPVTEWDATIYHAETARLWFLGRPDPPVRYGPSIGIEISSNYPPLFPAAGAAVYTLIGHVDDIYLRLFPPLLLAALLLMTFGYARRRFGPMAANISVLLVAGSPFTLAYGVWTTAYVLLGALILGVVILVDFAGETDRRAAWIGAGAVAGLAILCHFFGLLALIAPASALATRRPRPWRGAVIFAAAALLVASPWLLRNFLLLHDPFYPLGTPPFAGSGLVEPLWSASQNGIKNAALGYWGGATGLDLTLRQIATSLFDRQLLLTGAYFGLWFGLIAWRRLPRATYLAMFLGGATLALLLPGWYWVRAFVPLISVGALLTAALLSSLLASAKAVRAERKSRLSKVALLSVVAAIAATAIVSSTVAVSLGITGPSQRSMTAVPGDQVLGDVRTWGSSHQQLWGAFSGDLSMWQWLNQHLGPGERFATFEIRTYYLDRPNALFYLDGIEAVPLLGLQQPAEVERFLVKRDIRFVVIPSWAASALAGPMPLLQFLGDKRFPAIAAFPVGASGSRSVIYSVGRTEQRTRLGFATVSQSVAPSVHQTSATFPAGQLGNRIFVPMARSVPTALRFQYDAATGAPFDLTLLAESGSRVVHYVDRRATTPGWRTAIVPLPPVVDPLLELMVVPRTADLSIRNAHLIFPNAPIEIARQRRLPRGVTAYRLAPGKGGRVYVPTEAGGADLRFEYLSGGRGQLRTLVRGSDPGWDAVARTQLTRTGPRWIPETIHLRTHQPGFVEVWVKPSNSPVLVRAVDSRSP